MFCIVTQTSLLMEGRRLISRQSIRSTLPCATERQWEKERETCCIMLHSVAAPAKSKFIICLDTKINIYLVGNEDLLRSGS
ncbi:hypothetical protein XELAEV_18032839mg [Xenopus laevis]|uniref:Uncharacterized protein n=1 Tax=Xenopus laevis TaxID=8355 RepID=A0A974CI66_XENLA|nr:hypothetical protein XELAEV_18032839mg [Xenopus laevis]